MRGDPGSELNLDATPRESANDNDASAPAELAEPGGVRLVADRARDEHVEVGVGGFGFTGGGHRVGAGDGAELGADEDAVPAFGAGARVTFEVAALGADEVPRPRGERGEGDTVLAVGLLDAGRVQVLQDHGREVLLPIVAGLGLGDMVDEVVILVDSEGAVGAKLSTVNGPVTRTMRGSSRGLS